MGQILARFSVEFINSMVDVLAITYDYEEALVRQNFKQENVDQLRYAIEKSDTCIPKCLHDKLLLQFLCVNNDIDECIKLLTRYYTFRKETPQFCSNLDVESPEVKQSIETLNYLMLSVTPDNCSVIYQGFASYKPSDLMYDDAIKTYFMMAEGCVMKHGPRDGFIVLIDLKGTGLGHLTRASLKSIRAVFYFIQECAPLKIKAVHVINVVPFIGMILALCKPFMKSDLFQKVQFHSPSMDYEKFYEECIPKSCLPSEYGGDLASIPELREKTWKYMTDIKEYFKLLERAANLEFGVYDWKESLDLKTQLKKS